MARTNRHGQSTAEYAVLFALVVGAAVAMQQYLRGRLQGSMQHQADAYLAAVTEGQGHTFEAERTTTSNNQSTSSTNMDSVRSGSTSVDSTVHSQSTSTRN